MICPRCKTPNPEGKRFCGDCGAPLSEAAAAVSVLTQNDIESSGVTNIPDALRLVPGLDVAQVDAHTWAISSRGFNDIFANKLLVLIDGRTVYTPLFSGVFWEIQDLFLADIDRIEVVRGPGATLWGANAVNGVISIITKQAEALVSEGKSFALRGQATAGASWRRPSTKRESRPR